IRGLAEQARRAGAKLVFGRHFQSLRSANQQLELTMERTEDGASESVKASIVVGADGAASRVARTAGWPRQMTVPLVQAIVRPPRSMRSDTTRVWFIPQDTPYFFWFIPESPMRGAVGLIGEDGPQTRQALNR